jgi:glyceraldehyde 3-phosphate dehydrogenase
MSKLRVGINGFGRIGRQVVKAMHQRWPEDLEVVAINDLFDVNTNAHLLEFDTNYGRADQPVAAGEDVIHYGPWAMKSLAQRDPRDCHWGDLGVDLIVESTGIFTTGPKAMAHIEAGAKKVIISAPAKEEDVTVVLGVNEKDYDPARHRIVSNASCTTNCLAPAVKVVHEAFGIRSGLMCTIHSYTNDQRILDLPHKDLRRARAAAMSMIPTSTGAAKAVALVIPDLKGKFDGIAVRVPTSTVSLVDSVFELERETTNDEVYDAFRAAANGPMKGILGFSEVPLVSIDFKGDPRSSIVDKEFTKVFNGNMLKLMAWYDNEWGYSVRTAELAMLMGKKL